MATATLGLNHLAASSRFLLFQMPNFALNFRVGNIPKCNIPSLQFLKIILGAVRGRSGTPRTCGKSVLRSPLFLVLFKRFLHVVETEKLLKFFTRCFDFIEQKVVILFGYSPCFK